MSRFMRFAVLAVLALAVVFSTAYAGMWTKNVGGLATTLGSQPTVADTSESILVQNLENLNLKVFCEGDSFKVTCQVTNDSGTNWVTLFTEQCNGTDGTYALQLNKNYTALGTGGTTYVDTPPGQMIRIIVTNDDAGSSDAIGSLSVRIAGRK